MSDTTADAVALATGPVAGPRLNSDLVQLVIAITLVIIFGLVPNFVGNPYWTQTLQILILYASVSVLQNVLLVDAGQASFGQGAIFGLGAYAAAMAFGLYQMPWIFAVGMGLVGALIGGIIFALPALRVQNFHLGFVTLSAAIVFPQVVVILNDWTNGINGIIVSVPQLTNAGLFGASYLSIVITCFGIAVLCFHYALRRTRFGRRMRVAAASPEAAMALGISPGVMRSVAFIVTAIGIGFAGVMYLPIVGFVTPSAFSLDLSMLFFFAIVVGGRGQILGPILGIIILYFLPNVVFAQFLDYRLLAYGAVTLAVVLLFPDGIVGSFEKWRIKRRHATPDGGLRLDRMIADDLVPAAVGKPVTQAGDVVVKVRGGSKTFGSVVALDGVDLDIRRGEIHGLIGANGSGKTSLLNVLSGFSRLSGGTVSIKDAEITRLSASQIARLGIGRTFQTPRVFSFFSIWDNLRVGLDANPNVDAQLKKRAGALKGRLDTQSAEWLPHGQRRLVEVMRVVLQNADVLLLDEPAAGLSPEERVRFSELLKYLRDTLGTTIILVEHDLDLVLGIADRITVLDTGRVVATGAPAEIASNPAAKHMFVKARNA
ncbi:MAG TPA: branched-chain amino acid ABC transporter ATP-binding protein/permease [Devosia sp.]|nr:branched-chain amino acid ABC transporter ATP-binding protein/permease [Devosia sp.]